jgi:hypothetical protein
MGLLDKLRGRLDRDGFAEEVAKRIHASGVSVTPSADGSSIEWRASTGAKGTVYLVNAWTDYQSAADAAGRERVITNLARAPFELQLPVPETFAEARSLVRPVLRDRMHAATVRLQTSCEQGKLIEICARPLGAHLLEELAIDLPSAIAGVSRDQLSRWGISLEEAFAEAEKNLGRVSHAKWREVAPGLFQAPFDDDYAAARLCLPHIVSALPLRGDPVALPLSRSHLFVTGADDADGLGALARAAEGSHRLPRAMSAFAVRFHAGRWSDLELPLDHPAAAAFLALRYEWRARNYGEQQPWLARIHGNEVYVADYKVFRRPTGGLQSMTTLTLECDSLLPRTDLLSVVHVESREKAELIALVPWDQAAGAIPLAADESMYPERIRTDGRFDAAQIEALRRLDLRPAEERR